jgi:hypothetical protein
MSNRCLVGVSAAAFAKLLQPTVSGGMRGRGEVSGFRLWGLASVRVLDHSSC